MDIQDHQRLTPYLESGEHLIWAGGPKTGFVLTRADIFKIPFSLIWGGIAFLWEIIAYATGAPLVSLLFGAPFVLVGLYLIAGRFFIDMLRRSNTVYGLTERRVLVLSGIASQTLKALQIRDLPQTTLSVRPDGRGTITFGPTSIFDDLRFAFKWRVELGATVPAFELIEGAPDVYQTLQGLQEHVNVTS